MTGKLERMFMDAVVTQFKAQYKHLPGEVE
jgi:hypothetical protein